MKQTETEMQKEQSNRDKTSNVTIIDYKLYINDFECIVNEF